MALTQPQLDDLLEQLISLTAVPDPERQRHRLAMLSLLLMQQVDDAELVRAQIEAVAAAEQQTLILNIP
jgi:hypothetical protein